MQIISLVRNYEYEGALQLLGGSTGNYSTRYLKTSGACGLQEKSDVAGRQQNYFFL